MRSALLRFAARSRSASPLVFALTLAACGEPEGMQPTEKPVENMPSEPPCTDCAATKFPDLAALFEKSLHRTCSPNFGVCHNSRQSPDFTTLANFVSAIGQRCNLIRDDPATIDNLCESVGDQIKLSNGSATFGSELLWIELLPVGSTPATALQVGVHLREGPSSVFGVLSTVTLYRQAAGLPPVSLALPRNVVAAELAIGQKTLIFDAGLLRNARLFGPTDVTWLQFFVPDKFVPGSPRQAQLADPNRDGIYGAELGGGMLVPGNPRKSYALLRLIAPLAAPDRLTNMQPPAPLLESQMPIANFDYWDLENAAHALYCWIGGLVVGPDGKTNALAPIDYESCGALPEDLKPKPQGGEAQTFSNIYAQVLRPQCATTGCHDGYTKAASLDLSELSRAHAALWNQPSTQSKDPNVRLIYPNNPDQSYLVQKLRGTAPAPYSSRMPLGRELKSREATIDAISTWINQGARNN